MTVLCDYCGTPAALVSGNVIYPHRPDLRAKWFYNCASCRAYVGCHPGTIKPLGRLANAELRVAKQSAHAVFDPVWQGGEISRKEAYKQLAEGLGIDRKDCHIGMFDLAQCIAVANFYAAKEKTT